MLTRSNSRIVRAPPWLWGRVAVSIEFRVVLVVGSVIEAIFLKIQSVCAIYASGCGLLQALMRT